MKCENAQHRKFTTLISELPQQRNLEFLSPTFVMTNLRRHKIVMILAKPADVAILGAT